MKPPVFVVGCPRSGTTLVNFILNKNEECFLLNEKGLYSNLYRDFHRYHENGKPPGQVFRNCAQQVVQGHRECTLATGDQIERSIRNASADWTSLLSTFMEMLVRRNRPPARIWGDKTPGATFYVDAILENHPKARIVYVKRHPLHVVQSLSRSSFSYASNDRLTNSFVVRAYVEAFEAKRDVLPGNQLFEVKYEDLLRDPERIVSQLCQFAGITYKKGMLDSADEETRTLFGWPENKAWEPVRPQQSSQKTPQDISVASYLRDVMEQYGYESEEESLSARWIAKTRLLPFRGLNTAYNIGRRMKYPEYRSEVLQKWPSRERLRSWFSG